MLAEAGSPVRYGTGKRQRRRLVDAARHGPRQAIGRHGAELRQDRRIAAEARGEQLQKLGGALGSKQQGG